MRFRRISARLKKRDSPGVTGPIVGTIVSVFLPAWRESYLSHLQKVMRYA